MSRAMDRVKVWLCLVVGASASVVHAQEASGAIGVTAAESTAEPQSEPKETNKPAPNSVFFEGLGAGLFYSFNYERRVIDDLGLRAGFSYLSLSASASNGAEASATYLTIPITASYLGLRGRRSGLEVGAGLTLAYAGGSVSSGVSSASGSGMAPFGTALVGYRLHPVDGAGFQFRVGLMALMAKGLSFDPDPNKFGVLPWFYTSFGAAF